ncbi:MAG: zinc-ribbon domain-containing protein [Paracoccaceae bacterium]
MRLICPNCDAQYEVDDAVIPAGGRDVQCSNCGHTWFQNAAREAERPAESETETEPETAAPRETERPEPADENPATAEAAPPDTEEEALEGAPERPGTAHRRQSLDEDVLGVLREEAEREAEARRAEGRGDGLESQPDLGLEEDTAAGSSRNGLKERMARLRGVHPEDEPSVSSAGSNARRDLLPDIEEINSTLRAASDRPGGDGAVLENTELPRKRSGFGVGFGIVVLIAALLVGIYITAPAISVMIPGAEPVMATYVAAMDNARVALNHAVTNGLEWLTAAIVSMTS